MGTTIDDGVVTRVFDRKPRRHQTGLVLGTAVALVLGLAAFAVGGPWGGDLPSPGWKGTEQAGWIAGIVSALLGLFTLVVMLRPVSGPVRPRSGATVGSLIQVGSVPRLAAWFQDRRIADDLFASARAGRTMVTTQVLSGMGGVGKTQLAARFARHLADTDQLDLLVWITAASRDAIVTAYAQTAERLGVVGAKVPPEEAAGALLGWLERTHRRHLIVLDNLDAPVHAAGLWPPANSNGRTLVTTRRRDAVLATEGRALITVGLFTPVEAVSYVKRAIADPARLTGADGLAADLGFLPLALAQATAYIRDRADTDGLDCAGYRRRLADRKLALAELLPHQDALPDDQRATVTAAWSLSVEAADRAEPQDLARPMLALASVLDSNGIPAAVFTSRPVLAYLTRTTGDDQQSDAHAATSALHNLHRFSLATVTNGQIRVHALVQRATREHLSPDELRAAALAAADALLDCWSSARHPEPEQFLRNNALALRHATGHLLIAPRTHPVLFAIGRSFGRTGLLLPAITFLGELLDDQRRHLGPDRPDILVTRSDLTHWLGEAGDPAGAVAGFQDLLDEHLRLLGPDHPHTLGIRSYLADWQGQSGNPAGAAAAFQDLLTSMLRILGPDDPQTLATRNNLALWRGMAGDAAGAVAAFRALLSEQLRVLGPDDPRTLNTRNNLASWCGLAGDAGEAVSAFQELLDEQLRRVGRDHPDTLRVRSNLAHWRGEAGDAAGAVTAFEELLADRLRVLGPDHPQTLTTRNNLAHWRGKAGNAAGAVAAFEELLSDRLRVLGPDHPDTLTTRNNLASWRGYAGDARGAAAAFRALLSDRRRVLGPNHPDIRATHNNLVYWQYRSDRSTAG
ncbi:FxSxx-COOH system tetratricopeptide repeat protein [Micromonospora humi]|nr:FxSxx-COOH system tetratricopeptide repeat protein [Micromonospora humi]